MLVDGPFVLDLRVAADIDQSTERLTGSPAP
jgi:hypothetical protein